MSDFDFARSLYTVTDADPFPPGLLAVAADPNSFRQPLFKLSGCRTNGPPPDAQADFDPLPDQLPAAPLDYDVSSSDPIPAAPESNPWPLPRPFDREQTNPERNPWVPAPGYIPPQWRTERERTHPERNPWVILPDPAWR